MEKGETTKEVETATLDGEDALWIPSELSDGNFYVKAELTDDIPEGAAVYAVYSNPQDGSIYRVKLTDGKETFYLTVKYKNGYTFSNDKYIEP